VKNNVFEKLI